MPAAGQGRSESSAPTLPPVDGEATAVPFSDLFKHAAFDPERGILVASDGRRYHIQTIPDDDDSIAPPAGSGSRSGSRAGGTSPGPGRASAESVNPPPPMYTPSPQASELPADFPLPRSYTHPGTAPSSTPAPPYATLNWGRGPSTGNSPSFSHSYPSPPVSAGRSGSTEPVMAAAPQQPPPVPPKVRDSIPSPSEVTTMMSNLEIGGRFGAAPLYGESDGGVQAAEALTDPDLAPTLSPTTPNSPTTTTAASPSTPYTYQQYPSSYQHHHQQQQQQQQTQPPNYTSPGWGPDDYPNPGATTTGTNDGAPLTSASWANINYTSYTAQSNALLQSSRQKAVAFSGLPSLLEGATVLTPPHRGSEPVVGPYVPRSATAPAMGTAATVAGGGGAGPIEDKEVWDAGETIITMSPGSFRHQFHTPSPLPPGMGVGGVGVGRHGSTASTTTMGTASPRTPVQQQMVEYDTQTPVVVHHPPPPPPSMMSETTTVTGRDNVLPGEDLLFEGAVESSPTLTNPVFRDGVLKVFRNTLTNDVRFHCRVERESETYWIKADNAQLVPAYAYDPRLTNVVYIRDKEADKSAPSPFSYSSAPSSRPSGIYRFGTRKELFDFQAKLTGEKVVLDIASVRMVTLGRANSRQQTQFSSARLQIWHEVEVRSKAGSSDVASFVTAGTALSGPLRERLVANSSRLLLYLGRSGEYITLFITDDLEVKTDGPTLVKLKPRKGPNPFSRKGSRWQWVKAKIVPNQGPEPAGFDIHGKVVEVDVASDYDSYKTFEIEFENPPSQDNFVRKWDEVMRERRLQRMRLRDIQEDMEQAVFTGRQARSVFMG